MMAIEIESYRSTGAGMGSAGERPSREYSSIRLKRFGAIKVGGGKGLCWRETFRWIQQQKVIEVGGGKGERAVLERLAKVGQNSVAGLEWRYLGLIVLANIQCEQSLVQEEGQKQH